MNDSELHARFRELRDEERRDVPRFMRPSTAPRRKLAYVFATLVLAAITIVIAVRPREQTTFTPQDTQAARAISAWRAPTDSLLHPPGSELLTAVPSIPSKGALR